jgi:hypothetical protein
MIEVQPALAQASIIARSLQWSRWSTTGTGDSSATVRTQETISLWLQYWMVLVEVWQMTGALSSSAAATIALVVP